MLPLHRCNQFTPVMTKERVGAPWKGAGVVAEDGGDHGTHRLSTLTLPSPLMWNFALEAWHSNACLRMMKLILAVRPGNMHAFSSLWFCWFVQDLIDLSSWLLRRLKKKNLNPWSFLFVYADTPFFSLRYLFYLQSSVSKCCYVFTKTVLHGTFKDKFESLAAFELC